MSRYSDWTDRELADELAALKCQADAIEAEQERRAEHRQAVAFPKDHEQKPLEDTPVSRRPREKRRGQPR